MVSKNTSNVRDLTGAIDTVGYYRAKIKFTFNVTMKTEKIVFSKKIEMPKDILLGTDYLVKCQDEMSFYEERLHELPRIIFLYKHSM